MSATRRATQPNPHIHAHVRVTRIHRDTDLRAVHKTRTRTVLSPGEAELFLNRAKTIARLIDSVQAVHNYYAPKGEEFDTVLLNDMVRAGLNVMLHHSERVRPRRVK